jgi:hypothetical protein
MKKLWLDMNRQVMSLAFGRDGNVSAIRDFTLSNVGTSLAGYTMFKFLLANIFFVTAVTSG